MISTNSPHHSDSNTTTTTTHDNNIISSITPPPPPPLIVSNENKKILLNPIRKFNVIAVSPNRNVPPPPPPSANTMRVPPPPSSLKSIPKEDACSSSARPKSLAEELKLKIKKEVEQCKVVPFKINEENEKISEDGLRVVRFVVTSDTHNKHGMLNLPQEADVLLHCGDFTYAGSNAEVSRFNDWLGTVNYKHKIVICGNHVSFEYLTLLEIYWNVF